MFTLIAFEILLFECKLVLLLAQQVAGIERVNFFNTYWHSSSSD